MSDSLSRNCSTRARDSKISELDGTHSVTRIPPFSDLSARTSRSSRIFSAVHHHGRPSTRIRSGSHRRSAKPTAPTFDRESGGAPFCTCRNTLNFLDLGEELGASGREGAPFCTCEQLSLKVQRPVSPLECVVGTTGLEPATSAVTAPL